jgi:hypothetical protein
LRLESYGLTRRRVEAKRRFPLSGLVERAPGRNGTIGEAQCSEGADRAPHAGLGELQAVMIRQRPAIDRERACILPRHGPEPSQLRVVETIKLN